MGAAGGVIAAGLAAEQAVGQAAAKPVKIIGIACSPRKGKTTSAALQVALDAAKAAGAEVELIELAGINLAGGEDDFPKLAEKLIAPGVAGIIIGTPVYMGSVSGLCKMFLDRTATLRKADFALRDKVGGALAVGGVRKGGQETALQTILNTMLYNDMIIVGDGKPTAHWGATLLNDGKDDVSGDTFGLTTAKGLGKRVAEVTMRQSR